MLCKKHQYFVLYRGDDTDFPGNQELIVELNTTRDLTGCSAHIEFQGFTQDFDEIPADKKLHLIFPSSETKKFALGASDAKLWLTYGVGTDEKTRTVENRIHIVVTNNVNEAYDNDDPQAITVTISGGGGGATVVLDDTVTEESPNGVKSSGIWSWVKSLLPHWLTSDYAEPATVASVATKADKTALDDKRDKGDLAVYEVVRTENTNWTWTSENAELAAALNAAHSKPIWTGEEYHWDTILPGLSPDSGFYFDRGDTSSPRNALSVAIRFVDGKNEIFATATRPRYMDENIGTEKQNQQLAAVATGDAQTPANGDIVKYDEANDRLVKAVAGTDYRDPQDNTCHKTEYGNKWIASNPPEGLGNTQPYYDEAALYWVWLSEDGINIYTADGAPDANSLTFSYDGITFTATRSAVCSDGKRFVTEDAIFGNDGKPSDMFTTDLLRKKVANIKANSSAFAPEYDKTSKYAVDEFVWHDGNIYQCKTAIPEGGEFWNGSHWELRKLDDFFTESNSLLTGTIDARLPYPLNAVADENGLLKDRALNTTSLASVTVPDNFTDLLVRASVASSLAVTMPEAIATKYGDTFPGEAGEYLITITKTGAAEAYVRTIKLEEVANA